jgi:hypothetical protein
MPIANSNRTARIAVKLHISAASWINHEAAHLLHFFKHESNMIVFAQDTLHFFVYELVHTGVSTFWHCSVLTRLCRAGSSLPLMPCQARSASAQVL